tara:strand:+ start:41 stop:382 length:342 start_codon:yes stop_codon:yes gene_type:complete
MTTTTQTEQLVTVVRQRLVLEEVVMTQEEFNNYNNNIGLVTGNETYWSQLNWEDSQFPDYCEEQTYYTAYEGDVTSFTDDCVSWLSPDDVYSSSYDKLKIRKSSLENYAQANL